MDKRSWPWKKKSSEKSSNTESSPIKESEQEKETVNYIQVSPETYARLNELEKEVNVLNENVNVLNEKLSTAQTELTTKESLVKQHAKVAEEAVSGWEKAESEANALKIQLENVTLSKLSSDERAAHLDGALKECMKQVRVIKEESEQKLHDTVFSKTKQMEKLKSEFEYRIGEFEQELLRAKGENSALSRSLHERSNLIMQISDEKSQLEAEIEVLKSGIQNSEREVNSLKYELHVMEKELEIRNEEKNMSVRSADVANRMHSEDLKKISKLEAESQRLRGLVRKKLPGAAALAQMKMEVESLGGNERNFRRPGAPHGIEHHVHQMEKENEFLTGRLVNMEEEMKMLKEALAKRNSELMVTRNSCAKSVSKMRNMEVQLLNLNNSSNNNGNNLRGLNGGNIEVRFEGDSNPPSLTSMSEDGDESESWCNGFGNSKKDKGQLVNNINNNVNNGFSGSINGGAKSEGSSHLELMDDFLEMEKLACEDNGNKTKNGETNPNPNSVSSPISDSSLSDAESASPISKLKSRVISLFDVDSQGQDCDIGTVIESIKCALKDVQKETGTGFGTGTSEEEELKAALSQIRDFVISLGKEASEIHGRSSDSCQKLCTEIDAFSVSVEKALETEKGIFDLLISLSHVLNETNNINLSNIEVENNSLDCVDKVTLSENKVIQIDENNNNNINNNNLNEEIEKLKEEKKILEEELGKCNEKLEDSQKGLNEIKSKLEETQNEFIVIKSKLEESQKSKGLTETQLKCMAESYNSLESRKTELENEINGLREKIEGLNEELVREKESHEEDLAKYKELQEQIERNEKDSMHVDTEEDIKAKQEREIAAAAEKLAECQETILFLGRQLQSLRPPHESKHRKSTEDLSILNDDISTALTGSESPIPDGYASNTEMGNFPKSPLSSSSNSKRPKHRSPRSSSTSSFSRFFSKGKSEN